MNRNVESHFAENPTNIDITRSQFDMSHRKLFSADVGMVIPTACWEVLPGDTFKVETSKVVRFQTMLTPVMDNLYLDTYFFFVPSRLVWSHWKNFMGESTNAWLPNVSYSIPQLRIGTTRSTGDLMDYMGLSPVNVQNCDVNALPFRCYAKIMSDWFRDENLENELYLPDGDSTENSNAATDPMLYCVNGGPVFVAAKYHDYFTSALPAPLRAPGSQVSIPIIANRSGYPSGMAPVKTETAYRVVGTVTNPATALSFQKLNGSSIASGYYNVYLGNNNLAYDDYTPTNPHGNIVPNNLWADLNGIGLTVANLRLAFQTQKFYEKSARGGNRYIEMLKAQFNVTSPDARLQRSEYLGGNRIPINVQEVTNNSQTVTDFLGDLGGMSRTVDSNEDFVKSFTEHGYCLCVSVVRYGHTYGQGVHRMFLRKNMFDFYFPVFANLSEQSVSQAEICYEAAASGYDGNKDTVFGYQEAWAEYRYHPDSVAGFMRPEVTGTLASWHFADDYATAPSLSASWIKEDKTNVDRTLAVTSANGALQYFGDYYFKIIATRPMPMYSIPGLIDHH